MPFTNTDWLPSYEELSVPEINLSAAPMRAAAHHLGKYCDNQSKVSGGTSGVVTQVCYPDPVSASGSGSPRPGGRVLDCIPLDLFNKPFLILK